MTALSIVIITKNEALNITDCLVSAAFADEILVMDSGSHDDTVALAKSMGAKVLETDWMGFGPQKNRALYNAKGPWIFVLDADERISAELANEIQEAIKQNQYVVFEVPRRSLFVSKFMNHSGWRPDFTKRLFKKDVARFSDHKVHEHLETSHQHGRLRESLIHYSYRDFETVLAKMNSYSSAGASDAFYSGKKGSLKKAIGHGLWAFIRTYFIRAGFLDGREGLMLSIANAEVTYYRYIKLSYLDTINKK
jgi:glycosyltransferase involved in cell wall biosynthesis